MNLLEPSNNASKDSTYETTVKPSLEPSKYISGFSMELLKKSSKKKEKKTTGMSSLEPSKKSSGLPLL